MALKLQISSLETAILIYHTHPEVGNKEIGELWGTKSPSTINRLKNEVYDLMREKGVKPHGYYQVNTEIAYEAWGLDINKLIKNFNRLKKIGLVV